jgi:hypothetical protein
MSYEAASTTSKRGSLDAGLSIVGTFPLRVLYKDDAFQPGVFQLISRAEEKVGPGF